MIKVGRQETEMCIRDRYKALEEKARQALKEQEERESARRFMNEAVEFLTSADKITKKALKRKVPIALYSSISRNRCV